MKLSNRIPDGNCISSIISKIKIMKRKIIYGLPLLTIAALALWACTKENPIAPNTSFTTSLTNNQAYAGEGFAVYLRNVQGGFITLFTGADSTTTYSPNNPAASGVVVKNDIGALPDSVMVTYSNPGTFTLTLLVASTGNQSKDYKQATSSMSIKVADRRDQFSTFAINKINGQLSEDGTHIYFFASKSANLTALKPTFTLNSQNSQVAVNGTPQLTGSSIQDFSALNPGDTLGRPVNYVITAGNGASKTYTVQYILRDPLTGKQLISLSVSTLNAVFIPDSATNSIEILYLTGSVLKSNILATVSVGANALIGTKNISVKATLIDLTTVTKIAVQAEDGSSHDYSVIKTAIEKFTSFSFTQAGGNNLNPAPTGIIDYVKKTINVDVLKSTDVTTLVASFTGLTSFTARAGSDVITSGVTALDYTNPVIIDLYSGTRKLDSYTVTVTKVAK